MPYHHADEMTALGQRIVAAALDACSKAPIPDVGLYADWVRSGYADVPQLLSSFGLTDPAACQGAVNELFSIADNIDPSNSVTLQPGGSSARLVSPLPQHTGGWTDSLPLAERAADIDSHLLSWRGDARQQFDTFFVNHINTAIPLQAALARSLALILQAHQEIRARANADVWEIGQKTLHALQLEMAVCSCTPSTVTATITVGTAAVSVLTAAGAFAAAMAAFSMANAIANAGIAASRDEKAKVSGGTPLATLANMRAAVKGVEQQITDQVNGLAMLTGTLAGNVASVGDRIEIPSPNDAPGFRAALRNPDNPRGFYPTSR